MMTNMKQKHYILFFLSACILLFNILLSDININAASNKDIQRIYDYTNTLSKNEISSLEDLSEEYYNKTGYHFLVLITNTREEYSYSHSGSLERDCELYSNAFYDDFVLNYGENNANCAILTLDISTNRYADVSGQGILEEKLNNQRCILVYDHIVDSLSSNNWYDASTEYMKLTAKYIQYKAGANPDSILFKLWFQILIAVIIAAIVVGLLIYNSGGKMTVDEKTYLNKNKSKLVNHYDHYIRTSTRRTKRSSSSSNGGGGSRSGGGSHGGGHF